MPFVNALEPATLLCCFAAFPPHGFRLLPTPSGAPAFETRFDLTTTADAKLQKRLRSLPGRQVWGRLLCAGTTFVGSTVSEYAWLPCQQAPDVLAAEVMQTYATARPFLIVKDLPVDSPLLDAAANTWNAAFARALVAHGFVLVEGQALAWVPIDFADEDAYLARLSRGARRDIRRKLRSRGDIQVEIARTGSAAFADKALVARMLDLYDQVYAQSEIHFDRLSDAFLRVLLCDADSHGVVFLYRHAGRLIGWNLCYIHAGNLVDKYVGFAYPEARRHNLYALSWMHNLDFARRNGLGKYIAGWTDPAVKAHLGARFTFTRHAVRPRSRLLRFALRRMAGHFESDRHWYEEHVDASGGA